MTERRSTKIVSTQVSPAKHAAAKAVCEMSGPGRGQIPDRLDQCAAPRAAGRAGPSPGSTRKPKPDDDPGRTPPGRPGGGAGRGPSPHPRPRRRNRNTATTATNDEVEAPARAVGLGPRTPGGRITEIGITGPDGNEIITRAKDPAPELP